jgi:hypothetical protein
MSAEVSFSHNRFGFSAMVLGAAALVMVVLHFWAGPLAPQKSVERTIAEIAVNISREVARVVRDKPAVTKPRVWNIDDTIRLAGAALAVLALILAAVGFVRREDFRPAVMGASLGGAAIAFQFVMWLALAALGLVLLWIVVSNLGEILSA